MTHSGTKAASRSPLRGLLLFIFFLLLPGVLFSGCARAVSDATSPRPEQIKKIQYSKQTKLTQSTVQHLDAENLTKYSISDDVLETSLTEKVKDSPEKLIESINAISAEADVKFRWRFTVPDGRTGELVVPAGGTVSVDQFRQKIS